MIYERKRYKQIEGIVQNGDTLLNCNLSQPLPHTPIFAGITGLIIDGGNLTNCDVLGDTTILNNPNRTQKTYCKHLHPKTKGLPDEPQNCPHVVDSDTITIDGQLVSTIYHREDTVL